MRLIYTTPARQPNVSCGHGVHQGTQDAVLLMSPPQRVQVYHTSLLPLAAPRLCLQRIVCICCPWRLVDNLIVLRNTLKGHLRLVCICPILLNLHFLHAGAGPLQGPALVLPSRAVALHDAAVGAVRSRQQRCRFKCLQRPAACLAAVLPATQGGAPTVQCTCNYSVPSMSLALQHLQTCDS